MGSSAPMGVRYDPVRSQRGLPARHRQPSATVVHWQSKPAVTRRGVTETIDRGALSHTTTTVSSAVPWNRVMRDFGRSLQHLGAEAPSA